MRTPPVRLALRCDRHRVESKVQLVEPRVALLAELAEGAPGLPPVVDGVHCVIGHYCVFWRRRVRRREKEEHEGEKETFT